MHAAGAAAVLRELRFPFALYAPSAVALAAYAAWDPPARAAAPFLVVSGVLLWTVMEYVIHRFILHLVPRGVLRRFLAGRHVLHHRDPSEHPGLISMPVSLAVGVAFHFSAAALLGPGRGSALTAGVVVGYLLYEYTHYAIHAGLALHTRLGEYLREHHRQHHERGAAYNFAILMPVLDRLLHTRKPGAR